MSAQVDPGLAAEGRGHGRVVLPPTQFLAGLFHGVPPNTFVELRLLREPSRNEPPVHREWLRVGGDHGARLDDLIGYAASERAGVFFGVLPRRAHGTGKASDVTSAPVVWADLDYKDYVGGEVTARERLRAFAIAPAVVVRSGHGLHTYWLLTQPCEPARLSALAEQVGKALGGDSVHDAARLLRLPGSWNWKDAASPILVEIEVFEPERVCGPGELDHACCLSRPDAAGETDERNAQRGRGAAAHIDPFSTTGMPPAVDTLLKANRRLRDLFVGVGKPVRGRDGEALDQTGSGYDYSFVFELAKKQVFDPELLAAALMCRPDGHARRKGERYVRRTVERVLEALKPKQANVLSELGIEKVIVYESEPARYEFHLGERHFRLDAGALLSPARFSEAYVQAAFRTPPIPNKRDEWHAWVDLLLAGAERVALPPDASDEAVLRERVLTTIANLPLTAEIAELDGKALQVSDSRRAFRPDAVRKLLLDDFKDLGRADLCRVLRALGFDSGSHRVGDAVVRLWAAKEQS